MLHAFDGSPSQALEASALCWSPDSRSLVLRRANGDLIRRDLTGGPAVAFATKSPVSVSCTWNRDGVLLLGGGPGPFQRSHRLGPDAHARGTGGRRRHCDYVICGRTDVQRHCRDRLKAPTRSSLVPAAKREHFTLLDALPGRHAQISRRAIRALTLVAQPSQPLSRVRVVRTDATL